MADPRVSEAGATLAPLLHGSDIMCGEGRFENMQMWQGSENKMVALLSVWLLESGTA